MKRIASVFSRDRNDRKNEKIPKRTSVTALNVRTQPILSDITTFDSMISTPQLSAGGSEVSSTGGSSLQTPEDVPMAHNTKKTWIPWLNKKSGTIKASANRPHSAWTPSQPPPLLRPPPGARPAAQTLEPSQDPDSDDSSDDGYGHDDHHPLTAIITPESLSKSRVVLQAFIQNSLNDRPNLAPPFVISPNVPSYPRSTNPARSLPRSSSNSLASTVFKRRMLRRLSDPNLQPSEAESIIPFSLRSIPPRISSTKSDMIDEKALSGSDRTSSFSSGLRRWTSRPCFEDRFCVWTAVDGNITCQRISNSPGFALASLEFSPAIEVGADAYGHDPLPSPPQLAPIELRFPPSSSDDGTSSSSSHVSSSASHARSNPSPQLLAPSPLRNQASTISSSKSIEDPRKEASFRIQPPAVREPIKSISPASPPDAIPPSALKSTTVKRGVRFAEEDKDENIPVGYVMRVKKQREDKARFLREEKERRLFEEERARAGEERRKREAERRKWEQEKLAWENERRAMEEERKRKLYTEEVTAARERAESSRMGMRGSSSGSLRESPSTSKRLSYGFETLHGPRRQASEPFQHNHSATGARTTSGMSFNSPASRPASIHSSSEDVRSNRPVSSALFVPPVPSIPQFYPYPSGFAMDMPLLPPAAPFMVNQFSRRQSHTPKSSSQQRVPSNSSAESLNRQSVVHGRQGSSPVSRDASSSSQSASPHRTHQRRTSDDNTRRVPAHSLSPHSSSNLLPRGRSTNSVHTQQMESPWSAPPMAHGGFPSPSGMNTATRHTPARRQTTLS